MNHIILFWENNCCIIYLIGDDSKVDTPDPIPNSEVKHFNADDSHAKIGSCQFFFVIKSEKIGFLYFITLNLIKVCKKSKL